MVRHRHRNHHPVRLGTTGIKTAQRILHTLLMARTASHQAACLCLHTCTAPCPPRPMSRHAASLVVTLAPRTPECDGLVVKGLIKPPHASSHNFLQSVLLIALVGSTASVTGFPNAAHVPAIIWGGLPTSAALFSFCFSGHAVRCGAPDNTSGLGQRGVSEGQLVGQKAWGLKPAKGQAGTKQGWRVRGSRRGPFMRDRIELSVSVWRVVAGQSLSFGKACGRRTRHLMVVRSAPHAPLCLHHRVCRYCQCDLTPVRCCFPLLFLLVSPSLSARIIACANTASVISHQCAAASPAFLANPCHLLLCTCTPPRAPSLRCNHTCCLLLLALQVFPSLYASLRCKRNFTYVLFGSFALVMVMYGSIAIMG